MRDPADRTPPVVSFDNSVINAVLTAPFNILGTVSDSNLDSWTLEIATPNNPNFTVLATGQTTVNDAALAQLVPANLANGFYQLLLTAIDMSGRTAQTQTQIEINTPTKPNDNVVTDADVSVNLDGTTVLIERTYDPLMSGRHGRLRLWLDLRSTARRTSRRTCRRRARKTSASSTPSATARRCT